MTKQEFKQQLLVVAKNGARKLNYQISAQVETTLIDFINSGVERMTSSDLLSEARQKEAEKNLEKLIEYMVNDAKQRRISENIDVKAFSSVRMSICPLWPFC